LQAGHWPTHLDDSFPHDWQKNTILPFAILLPLL